MKFSKITYEIDCSWIFITLLLTTLTLLPYVQSTSTCFGNDTDPCCDGFVMSEVENFCVEECPVDPEECDAFAPCRDQYDYSILLPDQDEWSDSVTIDYCDPESGRYHCKTGYYTKLATELSEHKVCIDRCKITDAEEKSCALLIEKCEEFCDVSNVNASSLDWCILEEKKCSCKPGYKQPDCRKKCSADKGGKNCETDCNSYCGMPNDRHDATCDGERCLCPSGFYEDMVVKEGVEEYRCKECEVGFYGKNCAQKCKEKSGDRCFRAYGLQHLTNEICDKEDGTCFCLAGYDGRENCELECKDYFYSTDGAESCTHCSCDHLAKCNKTNGKCLCGKYLAGDRCEQIVGECPPGKSGARCDIDCQCSAGENCTRLDEKECRCTPDDVIDEFCDRRPTTPPYTLPPSTSEASDTQIVKVSSTHLEYLVMAAVLATGMIMGVSVIGCYKLCCRKGTYVKPPSKSGDIIYRVKDDMVFICVKNSKFKGQDPQVLIPSILDGSNVSTANGAFSSCFDLNPYMDAASTSGRSRVYYKDAPGLAVQLEKNELTPEKKMTVQLPGLMGKDGQKLIPQKVETIRNDYTDVNSYGNTRTSTTGGSTSGYRRPPLPLTPTGADPRNQIPGQRPLSSGSSSSYGIPKKIALSPPSAPDETYSEPPPRSNYGPANNDLYGYNDNRNIPALYGTAPNLNGAARIQSDFSKPIDFSDNYEPAGPSVYDADQPQDYYGTGQNQRDNDFYNVANDSAGLIQLKSRKS